MASGVMLWHTPRLLITQQWVWPLKQSFGTAQENNNSHLIHLLFSKLCISVQNKIYIILLFFYLLQ